MNEGQSRSSDALRLAARQERHTEGIHETELPESEDERRIAWLGVEDLQKQVGVVDAKPAAHREDDPIGILGALDSEHSSFRVFMRPGKAIDLPQ